MTGKSPEPGAPLRARGLLLRGAMGSLVLRGPDGVERELARDVADPRFETSDGRRRVAFTQLPPGRDIAPDTTGHLVVLDLDRGTVSDHPLDSSPFIVPDSDDVLFVSGRTGIASLYGGGCSVVGGGHTAATLIVIMIVMSGIKRRRAATPRQALVCGAPDRRGGARDRASRRVGVAGRHL